MTSNSEARKRQEEAAKLQCDHPRGGEIPYTTEGISWWVWFTYCPKCGEKL